MFIRYISLFFLLFVFVPFDGVAMRLTLSEDQLNAMLSVSFPIKRSYKGINVEFRNAAIKLDHLDKTIEIETVIFAENGEGQLLAKGTVKGKIEYDESEKELHIEKPELDDFSVIENSMPEANEPIRVIRQTIGRNLPLIVVIDFTQLNIEYLGLVPKEINVVPRGVEVVF